MALEAEDRTEVEVPGTKRLQTKSGRDPGHARVIFTFHVDMPLAERREYARNPGDLDAVSIMRDRMANYHPSWSREAKLKLVSDLLDYSDLEVDVAK